MMTPEQKLKHMILNTLSIWAREPLKEVSVENIDALYDEVEDKQDAINEIRECGEETGLPAPFSRHYESESVAAMMPDGSWVGWTHWYGGGKHGQPEEIDWMSEAYDVNMTAEQKVVTVRTFAKAE